MKSLRLDDSTHVWMKLGLVFALVAFAVIARVSPHPANVAPLAAIALFAGAVLPRRWAVVAPVIAMVLSDIVIGLHPLVFYTWGSFAVIALASTRFLSRVSIGKVLGSSIAASVLFYLVTNFGVWTQGQMYAMSGQGLVHCYVNALPFFRATLLGDLFFSVTLFGLYALAVSVNRSARVAHQQS